MSECECMSREMNRGREVKNSAALLDKEKIT
jgi:hypothetical protein